MKGAEHAVKSITDITRVAGNLETQLYMRSGIVLSVLQLALIAGATAFFIHWWALAWFVLMAGLVLLRRNDATSVPEGWKGMAAVAAGTSFHMLAWGAAWFVGGADASFIVGCLLGTQGMYSTVFFSSSRNAFLASYAPGILLMLVAPFFIFDNPQAVLICLACAGQNMIATWNARGNRNQMTEELLRLQSEMEAARDQSLAKSQFLATMSHELRTPLNAVIGYAEILEEELGEDGRKDNAADAARIRRSARDLLSLINELLDFSKIEAGRMEVYVDHVDVGELINDVTQTVAHITSAHNTVVEIDIAPEARTAATDAQRLRQCLLNLMSNAAKFTDDGRIHVRASIEDGAEGEVLRIDVRDTGCGISQADGQRLFQPFTQVDGSLTRKKGGTGLGLVITKRLAELLGGDVSFTSTEGEGSTFTLRVKDHTAAEAKPNGEGPLVLVIEDESSARDLLRRALARLPVEIAEAHTASSGFAAARARKPSLIVLDIHLPDRSGWELLAEFKANETLQDVPVLVISIDDDRSWAMRLGACEHLVKPVDKERIASTVLRYALADARRLDAQPKARPGTTSAA